MNDRTLLELAARAYGLPLPESGKYEYAEAGEILPSRGGIVTYLGLGRVGLWNPLKSDGDALRLAVKLHMNIEFTGNEDSMYEVQVGYSAWESFQKNGDCHTATRLAITRAAAQLAQQETAK